MIDKSKEINKMWQIFSVEEDGILELRALWPNGIKGEIPPRTEHFQVADYFSLKDCQCAFETRALHLNNLGFNIYIVMNPIKPGYAGGAVKDEHILCRRLLLVDIDRSEKKIQPSNQTELDAAHSLATEIKAFLARRGLSAPTMVMSGNGYHLYYGLNDLENTPSAAKEIRATLHTLSRLFDNTVVGVDTTVHNASRVTKVPGTVMRKGVASDERPYRIAVVCDEA
jgi:hypothetical protein